MRKTLLWILLLTAFCLDALAQAAEPAWTFALSANLLQDREGYLLAVSRDQPLAADYVPPDLVELDLRSVGGDLLLRKEAAGALAAMFSAAEGDGYKLYVKSAYRSYQTQSAMYHNRLDRYNKDDGVVAYPGSSDHQTGLGVDILNYAWTLKDGMTSAFGNTPEARWMAQHSDEFGFILRYLPDKQDITGIIYEPWHFRYVGKEAAAYITRQGLSLEEFDQAAAGAIADFNAAGGDFLALCKRLNALPPPITLQEADETGDGEVSIFYEQTP